jgi:hypothetical protein
MLSTAMDLLSRLMELNNEQAKLVQYRLGTASARKVVEQLCQLEIQGPAYRVIAMSICV